MADSLGFPILLRVERQRRKSWGHLSGLRAPSYFIVCICLGVNAQIFCRSILSPICTAIICVTLLSTADLAGSPSSVAFLTSLARIKVDGNVRAAERASQLSKALAS